jgi:gluconokinase
MQAGTPLSDADRWPWLGRIAARLADAEAWPAGLVIACSALRRRIATGSARARPDVRFVFLDGPPELIRSRMAGRSGHYMPESLLASQLATLEPPAPTNATCSASRSRGPRPR